MEPKYREGDWVRLKRGTRCRIMVVLSDGRYRIYSPLLDYQGEVAEDDLSPDVDSGSITNVIIILLILWAVSSTIIAIALSSGGGL